MQFTEHFRQALQDYIFLLEKKYPEKSVLEMVATRYGLNHFERSMLYRGVAIKDNTILRKNKLVTTEQLNNGNLHMDLFNVLFIIAAYLRGYPVYISLDGFLRDASESHGSGDWQVHLDRSLDLLLKNLHRLKCRKATFYIDNLLEGMNEISGKLHKSAQNDEMVYVIVSDASPDHLIIEAKEGIIATSDSRIIDKSGLPVFDLPYFILYNSFHKDFIQLKEYLNPACLTNE
jgi:hypothetical protein